MKVESKIEGGCVNLKILFAKGEEGERTFLKFVDDMEQQGWTVDHGPKEHDVLFVKHYPEN